MDKKTVLFVCTHNSARSQMAEAIINSFHADKLRAYSAGSNPTTINPNSIAVLKEIGADISDNYSKGFDDLNDIEFDYVVTVCDTAAVKCPYFKGAGARIHKSFADPSTYKGSEEEKLVFFRKARDEIRDWIDNVFVKGTEKNSVRPVSLEGVK